MCNEDPRLLLFRASHDGLGGGGWVRAGGVMWVYFFSGLVFGQARKSNFQPQQPLRSANQQAECW